MAEKNTLGGRLVAARPGEAETLADGQGDQPETFRVMDVTELEPDDRAVMFGTVVTILGKPYPDPEIKAAMVRVPMDWDGRCTPIVSVPWLVAVHRGAGTR